jgi:hypothetical protein
VKITFFAGSFEDDSLQAARAAVAAANKVINAFMRSGIKLYS